MSVAGPLKVSSKSNPNAVAGALAAKLREAESAELQAVGAGALNQAVKAVAIARNYLKPGGIDVVCTPAFVTVAIGDTERTGISLIVERRTAAFTQGGSSVTTSTDVPHSPEELAECESGADDAN